MHTEGSFIARLCCNLLKKENSRWCKAENKLNVGNYSEVLPTALWCILIVSVTEAEELFSYLKQPFSEKSLLTRINIAWKSCWKNCQRAFLYHKEIFLLYLAKLTVLTYSEPHYLLSIHSEEGLWQYRFTGTTEWQLPFPLSPTFFLFSTLLAFICKNYSSVTVNKFK